MNVQEVIKIREALKIAWGAIAIPETEEIISKNAKLPASTGDHLECSIIEHWLSHKRFDEIDSFSEFEVESPFSYLSARAASYYVAGYLNYLKDHQQCPIGK